MVAAGWGVFPKSRPHVPPRLTEHSRRLRTCQWRRAPWPEQEPHSQTDSAWQPASLGRWFLCSESLRPLPPLPAAGLGSGSPRLPNPASRCWDPWGPALGLRAQRPGGGWARGQWAGQGRRARPGLESRRPFTSSMPLPGPGHHLAQCLELRDETGWPGLPTWGGQGEQRGAIAPRSLSPPYPWGHLRLPARLGSCERPLRARRCVSMWLFACVYVCRHVHLC